MEYWEKYTDTHCWVTNTYYVPLDSDIPDDPEERRKLELVYYQWVPLILMAQAVICHLPVWVWRLLNTRSGLDVNVVVDTAGKVQSTQDPERREEVLRYLGRLVHRSLGYTGARRFGTASDEKGSTAGCWPLCTGSGCCRKKFGYYLLILYVVVKLLFLANVFTQFFILDNILGQEFHTYGADVIRMASQGQDWTETARFPRVAMCDMLIRRLGNPHTYTIQCALTMNLFNEKIFLYLWFWFIFLIIMTSSGILLFLYRMCMPCDRFRYVKRHLEQHPAFAHARDFDVKRFEGFLSQYLRGDGVLVLYLIDANTSKLVLEELLEELWDLYCEDTEEDILLKESPLIDKKEDV